MEQLYFTKAYTLLQNQLLITVLSHFKHTCGKLLLVN